MRRGNLNLFLGRDAHTCRDKTPATVGNQQQRRGPVLFLARNERGGTTKEKGRCHPLRVLRDLWRIRTCILSPRRYKCQVGK